MLAEALALFGIIDEQMAAYPLGTGLIHRTWKVQANGQAYILQQVNDRVFHHPPQLADNIRMIDSYLQQKYPDYKLASPLKAKDGEHLIYLSDGGYFRLFPFINGSHTKEVVCTAAEAHEAARQFGRFTSLLSSFNSSLLHQTIPCFHDLGLRFQKFLHALELASRERKQKAGYCTRKIVLHSDIVNRYRQLVNDPEFKLRVTHHDTKISNVLFDKNEKGIAVIDLDTIMPGYFISDVGDMMRTYLSPENEESMEFERIQVREDIYKAIVDGYGCEMKDELTAMEKASFFYAGKFIIYMQALRFLTDYLQDDQYYGEKFPGHNLQRARNQLVLLDRYLEKQNILEAIRTT